MKKRKYAIVIPDGFADLPIDELGGKTPVQYASTPNLDALAKQACIGSSHNVPKHLVPGSDVATLSLLGYDPDAVYTGRAPLEALAQGIELQETDWAFRCNLVTLENNCMKSFTADHITTEEADVLLKTLQEEIAPHWNEYVQEVNEPACSGEIEFYTGVSYRNLMIFRPSNPTAIPFSKETKTFPPHDYTDRDISSVLPQGYDGRVVLRLMRAIESVLGNHPINKKRIEQGRLPVTNAWLWGQGQKPDLVPFAQRYSDIHGAMITAVDLLRGIAVGLDWDRIVVPNITGYVDTDYAAKGRYAARALDDYDLVCVHIEATDEAGHEGDFRKKYKALENIDSKVIPPILEKLKTFPDWRLLVTPDHPTPAVMKTHSHGPVPWLITSSGLMQCSPINQNYDEVTAEKSAWHFDKGWDLMEHFLFSPDEYFKK